MIKILLMLALIWVLNLIGDVWEVASRKNFPKN